MHCCDEFRANPGASLFSRVVILDFYDGPTTAIAECTHRSAIVGLRMEAWDDDHAQRVFSLAPLPPTAFDETVEAFADAGPPAWPEWWPARFSSDAEREKAWVCANMIFDSRSATECVIIAEVLTDAPLAVLALDERTQTAFAHLSEERADFEVWEAFVRGRLT